jgi:hypothetical protein
MKSEILWAAGGSTFGSTAMVYPVAGQTLRYHSGKKSWETRWNLGPSYPTLSHTPRKDGAPAAEIASARATTGEARATRPSVASKEEPAFTTRSRRTYARQNPIISPPDRSLPAACSAALPVRDAAAACAGASHLSVPCCKRRWP